MLNKSLTVEVHAPESWLTLEWQKKALEPLIPTAPQFKKDTDIFLFYESTVVDPSLYLRVPKKKRYGLFTECAALSRFPALSTDHVNEFRAIFTHDPLLLTLSSNYRQNLFGTSWSFKNEDMFGPPQKKRDVSMITSNMNFAPGHILRTKICRKLYEKKYHVDLFGRDIPWGPFIPNRRDAVAPYLFTISIENSKRKNYFTEKLVDAFVTRTVPIYWGCPNIEDFFNIDGMITFRNEGQFWTVIDEILSNPAKNYEKRRAAMEENFRVALEKYNVQRAWGSVADKILKELQGKFEQYEPSHQEAFKTRLAKYTLLTRYHYPGIVRKLIHFPSQGRSYVSRAVKALKSSSVR